jgi:glycine cleavage system H protein
MAKEINEIILKDGIKYADDHEWAEKTGETFKIGITDYAQDQLGDIVFVELPEVDAELDKGDEFGTVESTKAVSELYMPMAGRIVAVNESLADDPEQVNKSPYDDGWMIEIATDDTADFDAMMEKDAYLDMLKGL